MDNNHKFYIDGEWVDPLNGASGEVINPATEDVVATIAWGGAADIDRAVTAARRAFPAYASTSREERLRLFDRNIAVYERRMADLTAAVRSEMGAPQWLAEVAHGPTGLRHLKEARRVLATFDFGHDFGKGVEILREPIGVCGFITPWNWPLNQIGCKIGPALATGCSMVLKPSEQSPLNALILAEILHEAGVPKGVFNLVNGDGPGAGAALSAHPGVDMVSFTGSTRAGIAVSKAAADTVKRVALELGGKSPNIVLDDADLKKAVSGGVFQLVANTGQSCNAPSRMLVPRERYDEAVEIAAAAANKVKVASEADAAAGSIGPSANRGQYQKVQELIQVAIDEGARVAAGGPGRPEGLNRGFFSRPTIFADVDNDMRIAREEVFGPVLVMIPYADEEDAIRIANDTDYGLSCYIHSGSLERARNVARQVRAATVYLNGAPADPRAPFGGYKQSGNGREWGVFGFDEFLETKAVMGWNPPAGA